MKQFSCPKCGSKEFTLVRRQLTAVDFSQEGAIEGHPFLRQSSNQFECFLCADCGEEVPEEQAQEMLIEVV